MGSVLQELSAGPLPTARKGNRDSFYAYSTRFEQTVHAANPAAQLYLYETWARRPDLPRGVDLRRLAPRFDDAGPAPGHLRRIYA